MDADSFIVYMNGITEPINTLSTSPSRPDWVPAPNPQSSFKGVYFSPMTRLTRLECSLYLNDFYSPNHIPGVNMFDTSNMILQFCWLLELNPRLISLTLSGVQFESTINRALLARSIGSLNELKHLHVEHRGSNEHSFESMATIFSYLPASLVSLVLRTGFSKENTPEESDLHHVMKTMVPRDGPLFGLKELELPILEVLPESDYGRILENCPNINTLCLRPMHRESALTIKEIAPLVKRYCPLIRNIKANRTISWWYDWNPFDILDGVKSSLETLHIGSYNLHFDEVCESLSISSIQHHSVTLRDIRLTGCLSLSNEVMKSILTTCALLERLEISGRLDKPAVANLPDIVAHKWVCTGLKHLEMTIDWGRFEDPTPNHLPAYYLGHSDSPPSVQDQGLWNLLERLYRQIGSLVELENLKELRGSVHLGNPEVAMTLKQDEAEWMVENWPKLQVLELLPNQEEAPVRVDVDGYAHLNWLLKRRPTLDLRRSWESPMASWDGLWTQVELDELMTAQHKN
ncbi:hypothetical protein BGZ96_004936 [Linnemannia gamsii]|uniref:Uncharacterized protein n=1 Tax=Linnemannia gamsii TaxID=64522 RepID=A0ABQ7K6M7_9FUNG|nr:hypothetical protein BGZ96_004936 [Linnemannia gamsii]